MDRKYIEWPWWWWFVILMLLPWNATVHASDTLYPTSTGTYNSWGAYPSTLSKWLRVDEPSVLDSTDYISETTLNDMQSFGVTAWGGGGTVDSVVMHFWADDNSSAHTSKITPFVVMGGDDSMGTEITTVLAVTEYSEIIATGWDSAAVATMEIGVKASELTSGGPGSPYVSCYWMFAVVYWTAAEPSGNPQIIDRGVSPCGPRLCSPCSWR